MIWLLLFLLTLSCVLSVMWYLEHDSKKTWRTYYYSAEGRRAALATQAKTDEDARQALRNELSKVIAERDAARRLVAACEDTHNREKKAKGLIEQVCTVLGLNVVSK